MPTVYPCVPGHEIVGRVTKAGSAVTRFKPSDLAAVGCTVDSDRVCPECKAGLEQFCPDVTLTYDFPDKHLRGVTYRTPHDFKRCHHFRGFVYARARFSSDHNNIEVSGFFVFLLYAMRRVDCRHAKKPNWNGQSLKRRLPACKPYRWSGWHKLRRNAR
jgi:hypothetical protein